jgi:hypothetical protein
MSHSARVIRPVIAGSSRSHYSAVPSTVPGTNPYRRSAAADTVGS